MCQSTYKTLHLLKNFKLLLLKMLQFFSVLFIDKTCLSQLVFISSKLISIKRNSFNFVGNFGTHASEHNEYFS